MFNFQRNVGMMKVKCVLRPFYTVQRLPQRVAPTTRWGDALYRVNSLFWLRQRVEPTVERIKHVNRRLNGWGNVARCKHCAQWSRDRLLQLCKFRSMKRAQHIFSTVVHMMSHARAKSRSTYITLNMATREWSLDECSKLIAVYKRYPVLWKTDHPSYGKRGPRDAERRGFILIGSCAAVAPTVAPTGCPNRSRDRCSNLCRSRDRLGQPSHRVNSTRDRLPQRLGQRVGATVVPCKRALRCESSDRRQL
jgi:hypothetical protein